ncbi:MAG: disulfide bond formation protein B [Burkholderiaceae bacterium]
MSNTTSRLLNLIALLCIGAVGIALISQYVFGLQPCAWCVLQRLIYLLIAVFCWLGLLLNRQAAVRKTCALIAVLLSLGGAAAAWYQYDVAAQLFSCKLTFADRFMVGAGLDAHVPWLFGILASCADAKARVLGLEYSLWSLALFFILGVLSVAVLLRRR